MAARSAQHLPETPSGVRDRLLRAAQAQILATGFFEANMEQIARRAGTSKQTIYANFQSKEDLFREVLRMTMAEAGQAGEPDIASLGFAEAVRAYVLWIEKSALNPENLELYRANIAAAAAFPALAAELHHLRQTASHMGHRLLTHPGRAHLPAIPPERLSSWLGVLAMAGPRALLGFTPTPDERRARQQAIVQLCTGGWRIPVEPCPAALPLIEPAAHAPRQIEPGSRLSPERWTHLLRIALRGFAQTGLRHTSVEEIGAVAQISKMTIYKRFGNKQGLFAAAIDQAVDDLLAVREPLTFDGDIRSALEIVARQQDHWVQRPEYSALLCLMITQAPAHEAMIQRAWSRLTAPTLNELTTRLRQWQAEGAVHLVDPVIAAEQFLLLAARGNRRLTATLPWEEDEVRRHARDVVSLFYH